ncbi:MAG: DUF4932 domain-containing protein [Bacteroidota bacterium]
MKTIHLLTAIMLFFATACTSNRQVQNAGKTDATAKIHFNKNVEFFGYVIQLAEPEAHDPNHPITPILAQGANDINIPALQKIYETGGHLPYDTFVKLFYTLPELPLPENYTISSEVLKSYGMTTEEELETMNALLGYANQFYQSSQFEKIWAALEPHRQSTLELLEDNLPSTALLRQLEGFYQQGFTGYEVVPSLTIWSGPGWGFQTLEREGKVANFVLGPLEPDFNYTDGARFENLAIHEFGHSFVNHVVLGTVGEQITQTEALFEPVREAMAPQGYQNWETCVIEHFVRAGEVLIPELMGNTTASQVALTRHAESRSFIYLPFIVDQLRAYRVKQDLPYEQAVRRTMDDLREIVMERKE